MPTTAQISTRAAFWLAHTTAGEAIGRHEKIIRPHTEAIAALRERQELLEEAFGIEVAAWCEFCGAPLTENEAMTVTDEGGFETITTCRFTDDGQRTDACHKADIEAARRAMGEDED